jgi:hypothetical protein
MQPDYPSPTAVTRLEPPEFRVCRVRTAAEQEGVVRVLERRRLDAIREHLRKVWGWQP